MANVEQQNIQTNVPNAGSHHQVIEALGRLSAAWGHLEFCLLLLYFAIGSTKNPIDIRHGNKGRNFDIDTLSSAFYSLDSNRARIRLVQSLTKIRKEKGLLSTDKYQEIDTVLREIPKLARQRNTYAHAGFIFDSDNAWILHAGVFHTPQQRTRVNHIVVNSISDDCQKISASLATIIKSISSGLEQP